MFSLTSLYHSFKARQAAKKLAKEQKRDNDIEVETQHVVHFSVLLHLSPNDGLGKLELDHHAKLLLLNLSAKFYNDSYSIGMHFDDLARQIAAASGSNEPIKEWEELKQDFLNKLDRELWR